MWETILGWGGWGTVGSTFAWVVTSCLLVAGLAGCILPVLPGHLILLIAAVAHRLMLGREESGLAWWSFLVLAAFMTISQASEFASGAAGTRWFGGTKWCAWGAFIGSLIGMFFLPIGLLLGPLAGAVIAEIVVEKRHPKPAVVSGIGSVVGTLAGMIVKLIIGGLMIVWFFLDVFWIGN